MVCFMGFLHVEIVSQECGGNLLAGSGWDLMFFQAKVFTSGVTLSILGGKHVKRTRYAYQFTLAWLHALWVQAYNEYCQDEWGPHVSMEMWEKTWQENPRPSATGLQWETTFWPTVALFVGSEWVTGLWPWVPVMSCAHGSSPLDTPTMPAGCLSSWKTWHVCQRHTQASKCLYGRQVCCATWRKEVLSHGTWSESGT